MYHDIYSVIEKYGPHLTCMTFDEKCFPLVSLKYLCRSAIPSPCARASFPPLLESRCGEIPIAANMAPVVGGGEEYGNSLNSSHNSATGGLGGLPGGGGGGSGAPGSAGGGAGNRSNTLLFDTTKNELYRVTENLKTLQRKLKASQSMKGLAQKWGLKVARSYSWPLVLAVLPWGLSSHNLLSPICLFMTSM